MPQETFTRFLICCETCIRVLRPAKKMRVESRYPENLRFLCLWSLGHVDPHWSLWHKMGHMGVSWDTCPLQGLTGNQPSESATTQMELSGIGLLSLSQYSGQDMCFLTIGFVSRTGVFFQFEIWSLTMSQIPLLTRVFEELMMCPDSPMCHPWIAYILKPPLLGGVQKLWTLLNIFWIGPKTFNTCMLSLWCQVPSNHPLCITVPPRRPYLAWEPPWDDFMTIFTLLLLLIHM